MHRETDIPADIAADPDADAESVARSICLRLLTVRARTRAELAESLRKSNVPTRAATTVLDRLTDVGLVNDNAFAEQFVSARQAGRGLAARELRRQLTTKGVSPEVAELATSGIDEEAERRSASRLVERKLPAMAGLESTVRFRRLVAMLARKGYPPGLCYAVVRDVAGAHSDQSAIGDLLDTDSAL